MFHYTQVFGKQFWEELFVGMKLCTIFAECLNCIIFNTTNLGLQRRYLSTDDAYFFRVCDENEKNIMRRKYLDILKKSGFRELCITYADLCKSENVDVQCWSLSSYLPLYYEKQNWHCIFMQTTIMTRISTTITRSSTVTIRLK